MFHSALYLFVLVIIVLLTKCTFQNNLNQQCGIRQDSINELILRGDETKPGYWPWHAVVYHYKNRIHKYACGGTLISEKFVLTAKHCVITSSKYKMNVENIEVRLGIHDINDLNPHTFQQHQVQKIYLAPGSPTLRHDIALIELRSDAKFTYYVQPACIETRNLIGEYGTAVGFGLTETGKLSDVLKQCTMPVVDGYECVHSDRTFGQILDETVICAGRTSGCKVCNGDSGGGLHFHRNGVWYVGGIVSFSPSDTNKSSLCSSSGFVAFTRVNKYLTWIEEITEIRISHQESSGTMTGLNVLHEESCTLRSGGVGQCQMFRKCDRMYSEPRNICGFVGFEPIVCCDVVRRQCDGIQPTRNRFARVVGDTNVAKDGEFPFMALIMYKRSTIDREVLSNARCGAALISKRLLLTAAQCADFEVLPYAVKLGTNNAYDTQADSYLINKFYKHDQYKGYSYQNDIAILQVAKDILLNESIKPICVYNHPDELQETVDLSVLGWGEGNDGELSDMLPTGIVHPVPRTTCQARLRNDAITKRIQLKDTQMCAIGNTNQDGTATDACLGDGGAPLVLKDNSKHYLVALTSFGAECGRADLAGIYSRVYKFLPWLIEIGVFNNL